MPATDAFLTTPAIERIFSPVQRVQRMLDVEAALAEAQSAAGLLSAAERDAIVACCRAECVDAAQIIAAAVTAGNAAIPLVAALTGAVARQNPAAGDWVHWGATSQDILDTATILQMRDAVELVVADLSAAEARLADLTRLHQHTPMLARTLLQPATAITLGYKLSLWGRGLAQARGGLLHLHKDAFALQLAGAVGTLSVLAADAGTIRRDTAAGLGLVDPLDGWHVQRDRMLAIGGALAASIVACAKMARDLLLMMQPEVAEAAENAVTSGGSSAMPHKRNPVRALVPVAAAANVGGLMASLYHCAVHEHERAAGAWHGEWLVLPQLAALAHASAAACATLADGMVFSPDRMQANLDSNGGMVAAEALTAALAAKIGKAAARAGVEKLCAEVRAGGGTLTDCLMASATLSAHLSPAARAAVFGHVAAINAAAQSAGAWLARCAT